MYYPRLIDNYLKEWALRSARKPLLLRGARQVGKSTAVRQLGKQFENFVEINLEKQPSFIQFFQGDLDVKRIVPQLSAMVGKPIVAGQTLLFIDEIQASAEAIMALRFFKEDMPDLHVIAAGSLLEFTLETLPTFGVGRIHSMFVYPMTFDEFLTACGEQLLLEARNNATAKTPLALPLYERLVGLFRSYMLVGGMPEVVAKWVETRDYLACQEVQDDIVLTYQDDFPKYRKRVDPTLLRLTLQSVALQIGNKFVYSQVGGGYSTNEVKKALDMLTLAGIITPVMHTNANGLPLGSEADPTYRKMLLLDSGLLLRWLNMTGDTSELTAQILTHSATDLVNKGALTEMIAGLELLRYRTPNMRHELFYWVRKAKNAQAEVDYLATYQSEVLPIEVKGGTQGGMKSLWQFMREKKLKNAIRASLENFDMFTYTDTEEEAIRTVWVCPLFALSQINKVIAD
ncbi:ATP-binding protein [Capnocytophaga leadbetteri]|uniref:ATP-binding protein n=1 Tax=Capnocytophaga leadbetteri TaxID=327575 RepID=UPI0028E9E462|nr:AAA family ATPase [Capnocytophaga leadbetteri]